MDAITVVMPESFAVDEAAEFKQRIADSISKGEKNFILDFSKCMFIDSTGLGVLVSSYKRCIGVNGSLKICSVDNPQVLKIFKLTRLDKVFEI